MSCNQRSRHRLLAVVIGVVGLVAEPASANKLRSVIYCSDDVAGDHASARVLQEWIENVQLVVRDAKQCKGKGAELRVVRRAGRVKLMLRTGGRELSRLVPWLSRDDGALPRLAVAGRLSELSVMITALLAESRQRRRAHRKAPVVEPPTDVRERAVSEARSDLPTSAPLTPTPITPTPVAIAPTPVTPTPVTPTPVAVPRVTPPKVVKVAKVTKQSFAEEKDEPGAPVSKKSAALSPKNAEIPGELKASAPRSSSQRRWYDHLALAAFTAGRYRASDIWSVELGGAVRWQSLFFRAGYQLPSSWDLQGRPLDVSAVPLALGWQPRLLAVGSVQLRGLVALAAERLAVRRLDLIEEASTHSCWDFGGLAGAVASLSIAGALELALHVEASWMPAGREVEVPRGPTAVLSRFGIQAALVVWWGPKNG